MKLVPGIVALAVLGATAPALAADLGARPYGRAPAYAAPLYNWTGFYIGGHVGGAFSGSNSFNGLVLSNDDARFLGGVQAGADYQFAGNWVAGIEGQYSWLGSNHIGAIFPAGFVYTNNQRGLGSVTGRIGYSWGPALFYAKGGYAYSDNRETLTFGGAPVAFTSTAATAMATRSAAASNICSPQTGRPRPSISITISAACGSSLRPRWSRSAVSATTSTPSRPG
jgi:outer membrane immunogenic protein